MAVVLVIIDLAWTAVVVSWHFWVDVWLLIASNFKIIYYSKFIAHSAFLKILLQNCFILLATHFAQILSGPTPCEWW